MTAEFVRRAERGLGVAIREGQERGAVLRQGEKIDRGANQYQSGAVDQMENTKPGPESFAPKGELHGSRGDGIYALTDNVSDEQFDEVLIEARDEGNLSRANVARRCRDCGAELDRRHVWRCAECIARRIEHGGRR